MSEQGLTVEFVGYTRHLREENERLRNERDKYRDEAHLLTEERDLALYELEREQRAHEFHHGKESR